MKKPPKKPASRIRKVRRRAPERELGPSEASGRFSDALKGKKKPHGMGPGQILGKLVDMFAAGVVLAVLTPDEDVRAAGGDMLAAMHGHKCGPECHHAVGETPAEREAWWAERLKQYDTRRAEREVRRLAPWLERPPFAVRCPAKCDGKQCCYQEGHALPHRTSPDTVMPLGGKAWWS